MLNKNLPITIASGHAGNYGASGCGYREEVLTKELVALIYNKFKALGYNIIDVSPRGNYGASEQLKAEYTNANAIANAQLHICVHFNASNGQGHGTETWIYALGNSANKYASAMNNAVCNALGTTNRGVKASGNSLCIPRRVNAPTILLETVFIDNQSDMNKYIGKKIQVADAIVEALTGESISYDKPETPVVTTPTQSQYEKAKAYNSTRCREIQKKLNKVGYSLAEDNIYGPATHKAIGDFQSKNGLEVDFLFGKASFAKLDELIAKKSSNSNSKENVKKIQRLCNSYLGTDLDIDGLWGTKTESAVKRLPLCGIPYKQPLCTKFVQEVLGVSVDGIYYTATANAVYDFQRKVGLSPDKIVGFNTYKALATK